MGSVSGQDGVVPIEDVVAARKVLNRTVLHVCAVGILTLFVGFFLDSFIRSAGYPYGVYFFGIGLSEWILIGGILFIFVLAVIRTRRVRRMLQMPSGGFPLWDMVMLQADILQAMNRAGYKLKWGKLVPLEEKK